MRILEPVALRRILLRVLEKHAGAHRPPAAVLGVDDGTGSVVAAVGIADLPSDEAATPQHVQDIASVSKVLTTLATLVLVSRKELRLDARLGDVLGDRAGAHALVNIEDLLRHRSGMAPWAPLYLMPEPLDPVDRALAVAPALPRGTERRYSDLGMIVLGHVLETVTGRPLQATIRELVLDPLEASSVTAGIPAQERPPLTGGAGDAIEERMVRTGEPYATGIDGSGFAWRTASVRDQIGDGNAHHAFGGTAGHAGWFAGPDGLLAVASALADPGQLGIGEHLAGELSRELDQGQGLGARSYRVSWRGRTRTVLGHPGFTGAFVGAAPATSTDATLRVCMLANRLHGAPSADARTLPNVELLWRSVMTELDTALHPRGGDR